MNFKNIFIFTFLFFLSVFKNQFYLFAQENKLTEKSAQEKKIYSQKDFDAKVRKEVERIINRIQTKNFSKLSLELLDKENKLELEKADIQIRAEQLKLAEKEFSLKLVNLEKTQKKLLGCADEKAKENSMRASKLVKILDGMKPIKSAEVLSIQDPDIAVKVLEIMDPSKSSKIFNLMDKEISARLQKQYLNMQK